MVVLLDDRMTYAEWRELRARADAEWAACRTPAEQARWCLSRSLWASERFRPAANELPLPSERGSR